MAMRPSRLTHTCCFGNHSPWTSGFSSWRSSVQHFDRSLPRQVSSRKKFTPKSAFFTTASSTIENRPIPINLSVIRSTVTTKNHFSQVPFLAATYLEVLDSSASPRQPCHSLSSQARYLPTPMLLGHWLPIIVVADHTSFLCRKAHGELGASGSSLSRSC